VKRYILQRLLLLIPLLFAVTLSTFIMINLAPGDPIATQYGLDISRLDEASRLRLRQEYGLNDPLPLQYLRYVGNVLQGNMGKSITTRNMVSQEIFARLPATIELTLASMFFVLVIAIPLGIISAAKRGTLLDNLCMSGGLLGVSMPSFWFGMMLMLFFSLQLGWLPSSGRGDGTLWSELQALIMPAITLGTGLMGIVTRVTRSSMLEVLGQDYMRTAHAKGLAPRVVLIQHGLRNALIPVVTILGLQFAGLLGGAVIIETIFAWPGIGRLAINAILRRDYPVIMGTVLVFAVVFVVINLLVDILYTFLDPRIRYE
jgi:ABC-type dipeptide/oligopeptide/nickel transport system permease component